MSKLDEFETQRISRFPNTPEITHQMWKLEDIRKQKNISVLEWAKRYQAGEFDDLILGKHENI